MIEPTEQDIGRKVIYSKREGSTERGVITGFNESVVWVRYNHQPADAHGQPTVREDLVFE